MGIDQGLEPPSRDYAGAHIHFGVGIDKSLIAVDHHGLVERHWGDRGGHALDEVDAILLRPRGDELSISRIP